MDTLKNQSTVNNNQNKTYVSDAASEFLNDGKKLAHELYREGLNQVNEVEDNVKEYSDALLKKVQENPLASVLIAGGIGFILSTLLKKQ